VKLRKLKNNRSPLEPKNISTKNAVVTIQINEQAVSAGIGDTIAAVLFENGYLTLRQSNKNHRPRGVFCGMGVCFECLVQVGDEEVRACQTLVSEGMKITVVGVQNA